MHEVIAAITTEPWRSTKRSPASSTGTRPPFAASSALGMPSLTADSGVESRVGDGLPNTVERSWRQVAFIAVRATRSWGRRGPARDGSMLPRSSRSSSL